MTEQSEPELPMSGGDFLEHLKTRHPDLPDLTQMSPADIVKYLKARYLKPRWPHWQNMGEVSLQQAVWLSFDIEPFGDELDADKGAVGISMRVPAVFDRYRLYLRDELRDDYDTRMKQCIANIGTGKLRSRISYHMTGHPHRCFVSMDSFRQWGESLPAPYTFPDEFPQPAAAPKIPAILSQEGALTPRVSPPTRPTHAPEGSVTDAAQPLQVPLPPDVPISETFSERTYDPSKAGTGRSATVTTADEYFRQQNARLTAQVAKFANEAGYAELVASVDAKDLLLNLAPDWPHWANMAYVTVSEAACLSLGVSPEARLPQIDLSAVRKRGQAANATSTRVQLGVATLERAQRVIQQRVEQAMSAIDAGRLPSGPRNIPPMVSLPRYRRWAESLPEAYVFPEGFPPAEPHREPAVYSSAQPEAPTTGDEKPLREPERGNWLAIIHALAVMAKLPERGATSSVERQLQQLGYETPKERTIRAVLNEARKSKD